MWAVQRDTTNNVAVLHAYDATNLANELYNSNQAANHRDTAGPPVKFVVPTVINGKVFVGAQSEIDVYGLLASTSPRLAVPIFTPGSSSSATALSVTISANSGASIHYTLDGSLPTLSSAVYSGPIAVTATSTLSAIAVQSGFLTSPVATATYTIGSVASAYVQGSYATPQTSQSTVAVRFPFAQQQGDLNVVVVGFWNGASVTVGTVSDSGGNVYQLAVGPTIYSGTATQAIYYAKNIVASGANTVTVSFNGSALYPDIRILEYTGLDTTSPLDVTAAATGSDTLASSGAATTTFANELIFGADLTGTHATGAGVSFTSRMITVPDGDIAEDSIVTATGSYAATAPNSPPGSWLMQMATFRMSGGGGTAAPTAPSGLSATANGSSEIDLSWGASTESGGTIVQYVIERCQGAGCGNFAQIGATAALTFADQDTASPLAPSTTYTYRVRAQDALGTSGPYSNLASATTAAAIAPTAPTALAATAAGNTQISLSWGAASETGGTISAYLIERCQGSGCSNFVQIGTSGTLSFGDSGLRGSTSYSYRVRAQDGSGNIGPYSGIATATTAAPVLTAPTSLTASPASSSQINLTWGAASETGGTISAYLIERCQGSGCSTFTQVASASGTSFNDTGLTASTAYSYRVRATDAAGDLGPYSNSAGATTAAASANPITFVQQNFATPQGSQSTVTVRFPFAQQPGDLNVVVVGFWNDASVTVGTVSDSSGNVYQLAVGPTIYSGTATQAIYYAKNIVASGANTVTVSFNASALYPDIRILEYSGLDTTSPLDVTAAATGSGTLASSGAATTTVANELIFGADLTGTHATGAGVGFTSRMITVPDGDIAEDSIVTATGSYTATAPNSPASPWIMQMATFRQHP
jgi:chitodextrinase